MTDHHGSCELGKLIGALGTWLYIGQRSLWTQHHLEQDLDMNPRIWNEAVMFFITTVMAHADEAYLILAKCFDKRKGTLTLSFLVDCAERTAGTFTNCTVSEVRKLTMRLKKDVEELEQKVQLVVERRNKILAHLSRETVDPEDLAKKTKLPFTKLDELYKRAIKIVNEVSVAYQAKEAVVEVEQAGGWDDYRRVLNLARLGMQAQSRLSQRGRGFAALRK